MDHPFPSRRSGFTLIELLVVIALILALAGILYPVFSSVKAKGREMHCLSNLRQIGIAVAMYTQDHDEVLPMGGYPVPLPPKKPEYAVYWQDELRHNYLQEERLLICPELPPSANYRTGYGANPWVLRWMRPIREAEVPYLWRTVMLSEKQNPDWVLRPPSLCRELGQKMEFDPRHMGRALILFADGHLKATVPDEAENEEMVWRW